ncbi:ParB/Srx family N-terminal domain-containing protein [Devosia faecipullorum]|uniref:ParB/Srx family N-terminal domain-containing protein n=1 Tax=Devosia faecipullorum TaxID=2755039 RepID=UPI00187BC1B3|nr:ParB N-terminal domain-containing protein [Devosia faecipullorum]MBE7732160.1 ParB N-terminal domain-containing protein [Devosia faecipullorum]
MRHQTLERVPVADLHGYDRNARTHSAAQVAQIVASIRAFGFTNPLLIDESNMIVAGHGRFAAARELGFDEVPCIRLRGLSPEKVRALILADNQLALNAGWDEKMLAEEIAAIDFSIGELELDFDIGVLGFSELQRGELAQLLVEAEPEDAPATIEMEAEPAVAKTGETWCLGPHRLTVGGSQAARDVDALILAWQRDHKGEDARLSNSSETFNARAQALGIEFVRPKAKSQKARRKAG